jgi:hypothetical protein
MLDGSSPSPQGIAWRVVAPQRFGGCRPRGGVAGGDGRDHRAPGGVVRPAGGGAARPPGSRPRRARRHPGRAPGRGRARPPAGGSRDPGPSPKPRRRAAVPPPGGAPRGREVRRGRGARRSRTPVAGLRTTPTPSRPRARPSRAPSGPSRRGPATRPARGPAASEPESSWPQRPRRRWTDHRPRPDKWVRISAPRPHRPRPAGPDGEQGGGSPCPDRPRRDEDWGRRDKDERRSGGMDVAGTRVSAVRIGTATTTTGTGTSAAPTGTTNAGTKPRPGRIETSVGGMWPTDAQTRASTGPSETAGGEGPGRSRSGGGLTTRWPGASSAWAGSWAPVDGSVPDRGL